MAAWTALDTWALGACAGVGTWCVSVGAGAWASGCTLAHWHLVCRRQVHVVTLVSARGCWCAQRRLDKISAVVGGVVAGGMAGDMFLCFLGIGVSYSEAGGAGLR